MRQMQIQMQTGHALTPSQKEESPQINIQVTTLYWPEEQHINFINLSTNLKQKR